MAATSVKAAFKLDSITVYIYNADITKLNDVDAIVCPTDAKLNNDTGVAKAITDAAGMEFLRALNRQTRKGLPQEGDVFKTIPGKLQLKAVLHAVFPVCSNLKEIDDKNRYAERVKTTIDNVLKQADKDKYNRIAMPPISSDDDLVGALATAIKSCCDSAEANGIKNIKEIHVVDEQDAVLDLVIDKMEKAGCKKKQYKKESSMTRKHEEDYITTLAGYKAATKFTVNAVKVYVYKEDVTKLEVDVIVNSVNKDLSDGGGLDKEIADLIGPRATSKYAKLINKPKTSETKTQIVRTGHGKLQCKQLFQALFTSVNSRAKVLKRMYLKLLKKANKRKFESIALPPLLSGKSGISEYVIAKAMVEVIEDFSKITTGDKSLVKIHVVDVKDSFLRSVIVELEERGYKRKDA